MSAQRTYAIGDIHGHLDRLREVHDLVEQDRAREGGADVVVHVGDLTDRGPDSAGVISHLIDGQADGQPWVVLKGNHDRMFEWAVRATPRRDSFLNPKYEWLHPRVGGLTTVQSYGVTGDGLSDSETLQQAHHAVPAGHKAFLAGLQTMYRTDDVVFVHAGIRPGVAIGDQIEDDLIWIREPYLSDTTDYGPLIIHGHTPVDAPTHFGNRVDIDSGVAYGGPLSVVAVEGRDVWNLTAQGRVAVLPTTGQ